MPTMDNNMVQTIHEMQTSNNAPYNFVVGTNTCIGNMMVHTTSFDGNISHVKRNILRVI